MKEVYNDNKDQEDEFLYIVYSD